MAGQHLPWSLCRCPIAAIRVSVPAQLQLVAQIRASRRDLGIYQKGRARSRLTKFIRFNEEIVEARFTDGRWHIETAKRRTDVADVFVCATGFLHKPLFPDIAGRKSFAGPSFHSARWDHNVPYEGKRWGVIGSGASGVQITEALAGLAVTSPNSSAARTGFTFAKIRTRPDLSA